MLFDMYVNVLQAIAPAVLFLSPFVLVATIMLARKT